MSPYSTMKIVTITNLKLAVSPWNIGVHIKLTTIANAPIGATTDSGANPRAPKSINEQLS